MRIIALSLGLALVPAPAMATPDLTSTGVGTLRVGMSTAEASAAGWITADPSGCNAGWRMARYPKSLYAGVWEDTVKVVATTSRSFATRKGIRVGDPVKRLLTRYPAAKVVSRNIYDKAPIYGVRGKGLYFTARKSKVAMIEVAHDFLPNGTEFEC